MKVYIWILQLAAAGGLFLLGRWLFHHWNERKSQAALEARRRGSAASRAERDRLDIEALTRGFVEPPSAPGSDRQKSGTARQERGRRAASHSNFDPDLPAPRRNVDPGS